MNRPSPAAGQSLAEFALILPIFLTIFGATVDFARLYQAWIQLQAATRVAAEFVAANETTIASSQTTARRIVCTQTQNVPGFQPALLAPPGDVEQCQQPSVTVSSFTRSATDPGANTYNPIGAATVQASMPFRMFFNYPFLTDGGTWTLRATESYRVVQGR